MNSGQLYIISAPSGAGKTTILKQVMKDLPDLSFSVSHTTRPPRTGEVDGQDYNFISKSDFVTMRDNHEFLEFAEVHSNLYGTSLKAVINLLKSGKDVILDIDVQGARLVTDIEGLNSVNIFITPPSMAELKKRLTDRATDSEETIELRLNNASQEIASLEMYDHVVVNDKLDDAIEMVKAVIMAERSRARRGRSGSPIPDFGIET